MRVARSSEGDARRPTMGGRVHGELAELLVSGVLSPGEKLSLRTIADRLGVSITPVRAAVARLITDHALEVLPKRAVRVPVLSLAQFRELTAIRLAIEGFAVERAAAHRGQTELIAMRRYDAAFRRQCTRQCPDVGAASGPIRNFTSPFIAPRGCHR
jgi:DNA-binding GntR family transcriptional regulator